MKKAVLLLAALLFILLFCATDSADTNGTFRGTVDSGATEHKVLH